MDIRMAVPEDEHWLKTIWQPQILGGFSPAWWRYWHSRSEREHWLVIEPLGFVHFYQRLDGVKRVSEIVVAETARKQGIGRALLDYVGTPITLKTDCDNTASNAFYRRLGFVPAAKVKAKSGKEMMIYEKW